jgi:diguanylate cyclase (GGDEF)-like protein
MDTTQSRDIAAAPTRILIVEDEESLRTILKLQLEREGYEVLTAGDGVEGLESALHERPDLIVLDWMMPRMDGQEVCYRVKTNFVTSHIPVIMLTARFELKDRLKSLSDGANDYITKPYEVEELLVRVRNLLMWSRTQREANPLTCLPGNASIEKEFQDRLQNGESFAFLYLDLDNFKAFNDYYGYRRGDEAIRHLAVLLVKAVEEKGSPGDFVGHVGGDDFVIIANPDAMQPVAEAVIEEYDRSVPILYDPADRKRGYIEVSDRRGRLRRFPLMTITIAGVTNEGRHLRHVGKICDIAAELRKLGKREEESVVVWERRSES